MPNCWFRTLIAALALGLSVACSGHQAAGMAPDDGDARRPGDADEMDVPQSEDVSNGDAGSDIGGEDLVVHDADDDVADVTDEGCPPPPSVPDTRLGPVPGELFYAQIGLGGVSLGESALVIGPNGTVMLIDVGNDSHDDDVADVLSEITGGVDVDHIVVTHFHADHGDGVEDLLERVNWQGTMVHRGLTDFTSAANDRTIQRVCEAATSRPGANSALCTAAEDVPCDADLWVGAYPAVGCDGLANYDIDLGPDAKLDFFAANGTIGNESYEVVVGPLDRDDNNGENARSVVALLRHGAFTMLLNGDLTGGGSDTDDVESFYVPRLEAAAGIDDRGIDVLHAGHHGRNTSTNAVWADRLLPVDGRARNAVMGVSTAHVGSPHDEVLSVLLLGGRLGSGAVWTTRVAPAGASATGLVNAAGGLVLIATLEGGAAYAVQVVNDDGEVLDTRTYRSVAACP